MSGPWPWDPDRSQAECSNGLDCAGRRAWEPGGMRVVAITLDGDGRCAQCVARERMPAPPEPEPEPVAEAAPLFDPDGSA